MSARVQWISVREAAERVGRRESAVRSWYKSGRVRSKKVDGRVRVRVDDLDTVVAKIDAKPQGRKPKRPRGRPKEPRLAEEEMPLAEFAARAGLNQRTIQLKRQRGEIDRYTEGELEKLLARREGGEEVVDEVDPASAGDDELRNASQQELKRIKLYHEARVARLKADREEGRVYDAARVEAVVRRLAHVAKSSWQQAPMLLPGQLAGKDAAEVRAILARYAQQQIEALASVAETDMSGTEE